ncbi:MAG: hypothetical protein WDN44_07315 [Sphingomonas sp.]
MQLPLTRRQMLIAGALAGFAPRRARAQRRVAPEVIGNPFLARWPDAPYPRNIWDMEVAAGRLYLGAGNSSNIGPSPNAGPVPIVSYDGRTFRTEFIVDEEQIARFYLDGDTLMIPGHDGREDWTFGNFYLLGPHGWEKRRNIPGGIHVYDVRRRGGLLVAVGGTEKQSVDAWLSDDDGRRWRPASLLPNPDFATPDNPAGAFERVLENVAPRLWSLFEIGRHLYASATLPVRPAGSAMPTIRAILLRFDETGGGFVPVAFDPRTLSPAWSQRLAGKGFDPLPGLEREPADAVPVIQRAVRIGEQTVYIGGRQHNDHQWLPFGLFVASERGARRLSLADGWQARDLLVRNGRVYALLDRQEAFGAFAIAVARIALPDGECRFLFTFAEPTFARSFAYFDAGFIMALGSEIRDPRSGRAKPSGARNFPN